MKFKTVSLIFLSIVLGADNVSFSDPVVTINISNPNIRRLVAAVPTFEIDGNQKDFGPAAQKGAAELSRLLRYSGLFNTISESAYKDLLVELRKESKKQTSGVLRAPSARGLEGVDLSQWKSIGVEALTVAKLSGSKSSMTLEIRTVDINKGSLMIGKRYKSVTDQTLEKIIRRYADNILYAYTGRPGIFNSKIVFIGKKYKKSSKQVYVCDFDGGNVKAVTSYKTPHVSPQWSKDGRYITYTSYRDRNPDLWMYDSKTGRHKKVSGSKGLNSGGNWSPTNQLIAYTGSKKGDANIYTILPSGGNRNMLIRGSGLDVDPAFSPDGKYMAFVSGRYGNPHIFRATLEWKGNESVRVKGDKRLTYAGWYNATPNWSPDSEIIAFAGYDRHIDRFDIFLMKHDGTNMERLTIKSGDNESPSWSPNGQLIVYQSNRIGNRNVKGEKQLYIMHRDGSHQRNIDTGLYSAETPNWSINQ